MGIILMKCVCAQVCAFVSRIESHTKHLALLRKVRTWLKRKSKMILERANSFTVKNKIKSLFFQK